MIKLTGYCQYLELFEHNFNASNKKKFFSFRDRLRDQI